ncbi:MAG: ATP-dependent helicase [Opitutales bacterium]|jgi:DNA helicase-2/ATP-dependent DNA helicase PcrA
MHLSPINFREELNDEQYAAVTAEPGPALVLAGAGSGKTRTLTYRVAWLMLEKGLHPDQLMLLTFTNKAAREMIERVQSLTGIGQTPRWSGTFHSIGGRLLRQYGSKINLSQSYTIMDQSDSESLMKTIIKDTDKLFLKNKDNPKAKVIQSLLSYARNTRQSFDELFRDRYPWQEKIFQQVNGFVKLYETAKREQQVVDYDDLLVLWLRLLQEFPEVREECQRRFPFILVDEYQDTNIIQAEIIDAIGQHHNIMAVGDDAQCIYTWRGAEFENIRSFPERHPGTCIYKILTNYRSIPPILNLANNVLAMQPGDSGYPKELVAHRKGSLKPYVIPVMDTRAQAQFLVARIEALYDEGIALSDIAILYRAHYQALDAQLEFTKRGMPFIITSGLRFFEQAHVKDFVAQLRILANPDDSPAFERLLCLLPKVGPATVQKCRAALEKALARQTRDHQATGDLFRDGPDLHPDFFTALAADEVAAKIPADAREEFKSLAATFLEVRPLMQTDEPVAPARIVEQVLDGWYGDYIRNVYPDWENREEDLQSIINFASRYDTMSELLAQLVLMNSEASDKQIEPDDNAVRLSTIHQAKGLEYRVVFLISCADEWLPLKRAIEEGDVDEERRLFYVAVTRAMDELYISFPMMHAVRGGGVQRLMASRFLGDIPKEHYEKLSFRATW